MYRLSCVLRCLLYQDTVRERSFPRGALSFANDLEDNPRNHIGSPHTHNSCMIIRRIRSMPNQLHHRDASDVGTTYKRGPIAVPIECVWVRARSFATRLHFVFVYNSIQDWSPGSCQCSFSASSNSRRIAPPPCRIFRCFVSPC